MATINLPNTFSADTTALASEVNDNFTTIVNEFNGSISAANLASNAITTAKITDANVTADKLATNAVTTAKINDAAVTTAKINDSAVTSEKLSTTIACKAYRNAAFNFTATATKLSLDAETFDTGSDWDTSNGRFVAPVTGYYNVAVSAGCSSIGDGNRITAYIYVNGSPYTFARTYGSSAGGNPTVNSSSVVYITAGQYIELYVESNTTTTGVTGAATTYMTIHFIGT